MTLITISEGISYDTHISLRDNYDTLISLRDGFHGTRINLKGRLL